VDFIRLINQKNVGRGGKKEEGKNLVPEKRHFGGEGRITNHLIKQKKKRLVFSEEQLEGRGKRKKGGKMTAWNSVISRSYNGWNLGNRADTRSRLSILAGGVSRKKKTKFYH